MILQSVKKIAIIPGRGLGDGLLFMIISHNLKDIYDITLFNNALSEMTRWFPGKKIVPHPKIPLAEALKSFDLVISPDPHVAKLVNSDKVMLICGSDLDVKENMVTNLVRNLEKRFGIKEAVPFNGLVVPDDIELKKHKKRIVIHPTSSEVRKNWPKVKYVQLAKRLEDEGWEAPLCVANYEREAWLDCKMIVPHFPNLEAFITFVAESQYFIGNDSGIGHFASNVNIPTLSLFARKRYSRLWRPGFAPSKIVCAPPILLGARMKDKYWKKFLTVNRVHRHFRRTLRA